MSSVNIMLGRPEPDYKALCERLAKALEEAEPLAICWASKFAQERGLRDGTFHAVHREIVREVAAALAEWRAKEGK